MSKDNGPIWTILPFNDNSDKDTDADSSSSEEDDDGTIPLMKLLPAERIAGDDERNALKMGGSVKCQFCQYIIFQLQSYLEDDKTEENIRNAINNLCTKLPKQFVDQCETFVTEYGEALVTLLAEEANPSEVMLKLCIFVSNFVNQYAKY